jgi:hypothetical protein
MKTIYGLSGAASENGAKLAVRGPRGTLLALSFSCSATLDVRRPQFVGKLQAETRGDLVGRQVDSHDAVGTFIPVLIAGALGAALGDWLSYWIGNKCKKMIARM